MKFRTRLLFFALTLLIAFSATGCISPEGSFFTSSDKDYETAVDTVNTAWEKYGTLDTSRLVSSFFVECEAADKIFRLGTENILEVKGKNSDRPAFYRKNTSTNLEGDISTKTVSEEFFYKDGKIYTNRFGTDFSAVLDPLHFVEYTDYSEISVNAAYLSPANFSEAKMYKSSGKVFEIIFKKENDALRSGIAAFIGLDQTTYEYEIYDVSLRVLLDGEGLISTVKLLFKVDYYESKNPSAKLTYEGNFSQTLETSGEIAPKSPSSTVKYTEISDIFLLSAVTEAGYSALANCNALDALYSKYVKVSDTKESYTLDETVSFTGKFGSDSFLYGSIDHEKLSTPDKKEETSKGIFIDSLGYHERNYDFITSSYGTPTDKTEHEFTASSMKTMIITTLSSEMLLDGDIVFKGITEDTNEYITFSLSFSSSATKYYTQYLMASFSSESSPGFDLTSSSVMIAKNEISVTVRKSDLCIIGQTVEFSALVDGMISVETKFSMKVNSTSDDITVLNQSDFTGSIEGKIN